MAAPSGASQRLLSVSFKEKSELYHSFMPFVKNGGLFVPTNKSYKLGDEVFLVMALMSDKERVPVAGRVIWITPAGAQGGKQAGIGVQFNEQDGGATREKIETHLAGVQYDKPNATM